MNEHARHYAKPHFKRVVLMGRYVRQASNSCAVCGHPLPPRQSNNTVQHYHGECRKHRVALRRETR